MKLIIPLINAIFFRCGGWGEGDIFCPAVPVILPKGWGVIVGRLRNCIGVIPAIMYNNWWIALAYAIAAEVPYGESSWIRKLVGKDICWIFYGAVFGSCSLLYLSFGFALMQTLLGAISFWGLMTLSSKDKLSHPYVELIFGAVSTVLIIGG